MKLNARTPYASIRPVALDTLLGDRYLSAHIRQVFSFVGVGNSMAVSAEDMHVGGDASTPTKESSFKESQATLISCSIDS